MPTHARACEPMPPMPSPLCPTPHAVCLMPMPHAFCPMARLNAMGHGTHANPMPCLVSQASCLAALIVCTFSEFTVSTRPLNAVGQTGRRGSAAPAGALVPNRQDSTAETAGVQCRAGGVLVPNGRVQCRTPAAQAAYTFFHRAGPRAIATKCLSQLLRGCPRAVSRGTTRPLALHGAIHRSCRASCSR